MRARINDEKGALRPLEQHVDFSALAADVDHVVPRPSRGRGGRPNALSGGAGLDTAAYMAPTPPAPTQ